MSRSRRVACGSSWTRRRKPRSVRPGRGCTSGRPNPPASSTGVSPQASSSRASGFPRVSAMTRSRTRSSRRPGITEPSRARASLSRNGSTVRRGQARQFRCGGGLAHGEHQSDPLGPQTPRDEGERLRGHRVQPLGVIDEAEQRFFRGHAGEQAEDRETHQETVRRRPGAQAERRGPRSGSRPPRRARGRATQSFRHPPRRPGRGRSCDRPASSQRARPASCTRPAVRADAPLASRSPRCRVLEQRTYHLPPSRLPDVASQLGSRSLPLARAVRGGAAGSEQCFQ